MNDEGLPEHIGRRNETSKKKKGLPDFELPTPEKIKEYMDQYVIEQDDAKVALAVAGQPL